MNPHLARIRLFPLKSFDGQDVAEAAVLRPGALAHDREYCFQEDAGAFVNAKRAGERLLRIRSVFDFGFGQITLSDGSGSVTFSMHCDAEPIEAWVGERVGVKVRLAHNANGGFPDDTEASGPTIVSRASLEAVGSWFDLSVDEVRLRFRANLEVDGVPAFWEDRLFGPDGETVRFRIGDVSLEGVNPCARCAVPSRDPQSGAVSPPEFAKVFADKRREALPAWAEPQRFDHYYRLAVNTRIPESEAGKVLKIGDSVDVVG